MEIKKDGKTLYFSDEEIDNNTNGEKKVFVTKRINGKESHTKAIKQKPKPQPIRQKISFDFDDEIVIGVNNKQNSNVKQNNINKKRKTRKKQKKKNKPKTKKIRMFFITTLFLIIVIVVFALKAPIFNVTNIEVEGNVNVSAQNIISLSGIKSGENIFKYNNSVIQKVKENPYVEDAKIKKILPGSIVISIQERNVDYQINLINSYVYIDRKGYILENSNEKKQVPVIVGLQTSENQLLSEKRLIIDDLEKLNDIIKIMDASKVINIDNLITEIDIKQEYILYLESEMKKIYLGDTKNLTNKMLYVKEILEHEQGKEGIAYVNGDLSAGFRPYFGEELKD